jgi:hypothetical protein
VNQPSPDPPRKAAVAFEVTPIGRGRRRRIDPGWIVAAFVIALLLAAIVHPWQTPTPASAVVPSPSRQSPPAISPVVPGALSAATPDPSSAAASFAKQDPSASDVLAIDVHDLAGNQGPWGVGVGAAVSPPFQPTLRLPALGIATDQAWWAWIVVHPFTTQATPATSVDEVEGLPVGQLCTGIPDLPTGAQVLVVTTPSGTPASLQIRGWREVRHDEPSVIQRLPGVSALTPGLTGDVHYLQLADGAAWPDGRYEFRIGGSSQSSQTRLTVCLGQP